MPVVVEHLSTVLLSEYIIFFILFRCDILNIPCTHTFLFGSIVTYRRKNGNVAFLYQLELYIYSCFEMVMTDSKGSSQRIFHLSHISHNNF